MTHRYPSIIILSAEDDPDDCRLMEEAFRETGQDNRLLFVKDGISLLQYLRRQGGFAYPANAPRPDLILLDLNMPGKDGRESLAEIKSDPHLRAIPVVVLTNSNAEDDVLNTYDRGGAGFIIKPSSYEGMLDMVKCLSEYWFNIVELVDKNRL